MKGLQGEYDPDSSNFSRGSENERRCGPRISQIPIVGKEVDGALYFSETAAARESSLGSVG